MSATLIILNMGIKHKFTKYFKESESCYLASDEHIFSRKCFH